MSAIAVTGLSTGKRFLISSFCPTEFAGKFYPIADYSSLPFTASCTRCTIVAQDSSHFERNVPPNRSQHVIKALKKRASTLAPSTSNSWYERPDFESSLEVVLLLQKSMLEKQWELELATVSASEKRQQMPLIVRSGISARERRTFSRRKYIGYNASEVPARRVKQPHLSVSSELLKSNRSGYVRGTISETFLTHAEVVSLSTKIEAGIQMEEHRLKLKEKLRSEPSDKQLASSLRMSCAELHRRMIECSLATEKLAMSNLRLVMSVAQKYDNLGVDMADLIQGGLIGLLRGIQKFDSSKGFRISTYVYWWIRQGVSRALIKNSRTLRLPAHLHERLISIRQAKVKLEDQGITPSIMKLAESLNMSQKKVRNATQAEIKVLSLDREAFPYSNGLPGQTLHDYIADSKVENSPWHVFEEWSLKDEVTQLLYTILSKRDRNIIKLYHGIDNNCHTWEDIGKQLGLSRERVRKLGLEAMEKLKLAARSRRLGSLFIKQ
ncbi:RNA polymerase sigma factor sigA-like [Zingiber officinale]|uniref:RNA polymerase sigma factor sigA-like n=1 Tax=Zingiber officinale TaxID=94328 RepID=UPI001C4A79FD|nr:RNA polymerase sigma factor sigA-like [Zingiber officinale]XP_042464330.1 RNA polymerase sigma factor sigA-like [Zingiber officinale]XP_042464331.1 RNA polymerase sigma factor sigA-like [Zingiber officinale]XP_042464332.1 RNA polymerase sigma factor sigA-like [Zingiber officinale]